MPILADIKHLVELQMKKARFAEPNKVRPTPKEKVMLLTRILYEKKTVKEACDELQISLPWGKAIWSEHLSQYKSKKLYKKSDYGRSSDESNTQIHVKRTAGVKMLQNSQQISKTMKILVKINGADPVSP